MRGTMAWLDPTNVKTQEDLDHVVQKGVRHLRTADPVVAGLIRRFGIHRMETTRNYFQVMLETVISQQLSTKAAASIYGKLVDNLGGKLPRPRDVLAASDAQLRGAGLSRSKAAYVRNVAEAFAGRRMGAKTFERMNDEEVIATLTSIKGIGDWSAHMFLIFALNRLDVFPLGDLGLRNAMFVQYGLRKNTSHKRLTRIADAWRPYRTLGTLYLWKSYD